MTPAVWMVLVWQKAAPMPSGEAAIVGVLGGVVVALASLLIGFFRNRTNGNMTHELRLIAADMRASVAALAALQMTMREFRREHERRMDQVERLISEIRRVS